MRKTLFFLFIIFNISFSANINDAIKAFNNKEYKKSFKIFQKLKTPKAYYYLGKQYYYGYGVKKDIKKSLEYLKKGCKLNEPKACNGLGWIYQHNKKYKNIPLAVKYFKKACNELKYGTSCNYLGVIYHRQKDYKNAVKYYKFACDLNDSWGCSDLGWHYEHGKGVGKDLDLAKEYFQKACNLKKKFCVNLGYFYEKQKNDYKKAFKYYKIACDNNGSMGCNNLAWMYLDGRGVEKNIHKGYIYAKKAYDLNPKNTLNLGYYYEHYAHDYQKALKLYKIECNNNNNNLGSVGCSNISSLNLSGKIKNANLDKAKFYAQKAIKIDPTNDSAYNDLGVYYNKTNNFKFAFDNFSKACELNNKYGCYNLAGLYEKGKGVNKNISKAIKYYKKSCDLNYAKSCAYLGSLYKNQNDYKKATFYYKKAYNIIKSGE